MMTALSRSQTSIAISQNTAPVFKFDCLYTHDLVRKQKRWQDGILAFHTFNKRVMVYDLTSNFIGDTHWRESETINVGDDLKLDRGVLVEVGEARGRKEQDISEIFAKKTGPARTQQSPLRSIANTALNARKPKSITAVLGHTRGSIARANRPQAPSSLSVWSSPIDTESPRPAKKQRVDEVPAARQPCAANEPFDQEMPAMLRLEKPTKRPKRQREETGADHESGPNAHQTFTKPVTKSKSKARERNSATDAQSPTPEISVAKKHKSKSERKKRSKPDIAERASNTGAATNTNNSTNTSRNGYAVAQPAVDSTHQSSGSSERRMNVLAGSKSKRKKLIFQSLSVNAGSDSGIASIAIDKLQTEVATPDTHLPQDETPQSPHLQSREVIVISSPEKELDDLEFSDDDDFYRTPAHTKLTRNRRKSASVCGKDGWSSACVLTVPSHHVTQIAKDSPLAGRDASKMKNIDESSRFSGLLGDETLLAAFADSPEQLRVKKPKVSVDAVDHSDEEDLVLAKACDPEQIRTNQEVPQETAMVKNVPPEGEPIPLSQPEPMEDLFLPAPEAEIPLIPEAASEQDRTSVVVPASPTLLASDPAESAASVSIPIEQRVETVPISASDHEDLAMDQQSGTEIPNVQLPPAHETMPPPLQQQRSRALAPPPMLLRQASSSMTGGAANLPPQKPLPQFRPPTTLAGSRPRRSPLTKSLTAGMNTKLGTTTDSTAAGLVRCGSDEGTLNGSLVQKEYDESGPWSREAFDLFGWTPDVEKGNRLGPVAARGCGCRAAAAKTAQAAQGIDQK